MTNPSRSEISRLATVALLAVCTAFTPAGLSAQEGEDPKPTGERPEAGQQDKKDKQDKKDDKVTEKITKNDPAVRSIDQFIDKQNVDKQSPSWRTNLKAPPKAEFSTDNEYLWHVETTAGPLTVRYFPDTAPMHVTSGIYLARLGFYDGLNFHRIIPQFMAQGGDPLGRGSGGPGYQMQGEFGGDRKHDKPGLLSMANAGPGTDGSQFFLTFVPTPWLDGKHTIWGEVIEGKDTLKALEKLGTPSGAVANPPKMVRTWITVRPKGSQGTDGEKAGDKKADDKKAGENKTGDKKSGDK